jgi:protein TonB
MPKNQTDLPPSDVSSWRLRSLMPSSLMPRRLTMGFTAGAAALLAGCSGAPSPAPPAPPQTAPAAPRSSVPSSQAPVPEPAAPRISVAATPRDYRRDAARHLYELNAERIWKGKLQPNLYAIGTLQVELDREGRVVRLHWMRAPSHAPEVVKEIERTVRQAAPYPIPSRMGKVTYTDTWLWDKSGQFQLDTLTEGQL